MDKTQISSLTLYSPHDLYLTLNETLLFQGVDQDWKLKNWAPQDYDLLICLEGEAFYRVGEKTYHMRPGQAFLGRPGHPASTWLGEEKNFHVLAQHFTLTLSGGKDVFSLLEERFFSPLNHMNFVWEYLKLTKEKKNRSFMIHDLFRVILWDFLAGDGLLPPSLSRHDPLYEKLRNLADFISRELPDDKKLNSFLNNQGYSLVYMRDEFRNLFGRTPRQYRMDRKIERARSLLREGYSVKETAGKTGFTDELYFARVFKKYSGISPGRFGLSLEM